MTWLVPAVASVLMMGLIHGWVSCTDLWRDPMGQALAVGAYLVGALMCAVVWLAWGLFVVLA